MPVAVGVVEFKSIHTGEASIMKKIISVSLGTLMLLGAVTFGGFGSSAIARGREGRNQWQEGKWHHRHHRHHRHWRRVPEAASLRKRSW